MLHFKDGHAANRNPDNIELYCYNCWYMTAETRIKEVEHNKMLRNLNKKHYVPSASISAEASSSSDEIAADFGMALADLFAKSR